MQYNYRALMPRLYVSHSKDVLKIASEFGWLPGARYTNLRDVRTFEFQNVGFLDIDWKNYCFERHLDACAEARPHLTIARDVENILDLERILAQADKLKCFAQKVAIVPKDIKLIGRFRELIPKNFMLAYSVPTKYGGTSIPTKEFDRQVHLLGGRPDIQLSLAKELNVYSADCNRFTLDARYGYFFNGQKFIKPGNSNYFECIRKSIFNITEMWRNLKSG